jgi:uncharacterized protein
VLPNNGNVLLAAAEAVRETSRRALVVPSRSMQAGLVALQEGFERDGSADDNLERMTEALHLVVTGELTRAAKSTAVDGIDVTEGEWLGLVEERAVASAADLESVLTALVERMLPDGGVLEALVGAGGEEALAGLERRADASDGALELHCYDGGQPDYPLLLWAWVE